MLARAASVLALFLSTPSPLACHVLQDRMHLDCVFSVLSEKCCIMLETIMGHDSPTRRLVDEYIRNAATGKYSLAR